MYRIGIDVGGTTIKCGIVRGKEVTKKIAVPTPINDVELAVKVTIELIRATLKEAGVTISEVESIGVGLPGTVHQGVVTYANNLGWYDVPFARLLSDSLGVSVYSDNDARCALYAELAFGSAKGINDALMITLGTGVGTAFTSNGRVHRGNLSSGGEGGIMVYKDGVWEEYASTLALVKRVEGIKGSDSTLGRYLKNMVVDGKSVFDAEKEGIDGARKVIDEHIRYIADGAVSLVNLLRPEVLIIGGAISKEIDRLVKPLAKIINDEAYGNGVNPRVIVTPAIVDDAGIVGASLISEFN